MKQKPNKHHSRRRPGSRWPFWVLIAAIIAALAFGVYLLVSSLQPEPISEPDTPALIPEASLSDQQPATPSEASTADTPTAATPPDHSVPQYEGADPNQLPELTGTISFWNVKNQTLTVAAQLDQSLSSGTCGLALKNSAGETVRSATADITMDVAASVCGKLELSVADLASGSYTIEITLQSNHKSGTIREEIQL